jgi:hypothetical protein
LRGWGSDLCAAGGDQQVGLDLLDGLAVGAAAEHGVQHVVGDDGRPPCFPLREAASSPSRVASRMFSRSVSAHRGEEAEQQAAGSGGIVDPGQRSSEHLQHQPVRGEMVSERGQLCCVAPEPFHLVPSLPVSNASV